MAVEPAVKVIFCDDRFSSKYQAEIDAFFKKIFRNESNSRVTYEVLKKLKVEDDSFYYSESPTLEQSKSVSKRMPVYNLSIDEPIGTVHPDPNSLQEKPRSQGLTCFNCLGSHHLKDCKEEHDGSRIASNKRELMDIPTIRYHTDDVQPLENSILRPGGISDALRKALNLNSNQLPFYIYNMRILGYPPGWLKEAEIEKSGLTVYSTHKNEQKNSESNTPEKKLEQYDGTKFIKFPGFNMPVPHGVIDEWKTLKKPPLQMHQQLSEALKHQRVTISPEFKKRKKSDVFITDYKKQKSETPNHRTPSIALSKISNGCPSPLRNKPPNLAQSGSPLIDTGNPYKKLPDANKFSVGISEYLPYENLPDAVGSYDRKLRGVLSNVREKIIQQEQNLS